MIVLDSLSSDRFPPFVDLDLTLRPQELTVVVCPDEEERLGFVNLLLGHTSESSGQVLHGDEPLSPSGRRARVTVLRRDDSLAPDLSALENLELVAALQNVKVDAALRQRILAFAQIANGKLKPGKLTPESRLRLSVALNVLGGLALVIALDPQPDLARILPDLLDDRRSLLWVSGTRVGLEFRTARVHTLRGGRLDLDAAPDVATAANRRFRVRIAKGESTNPKTLLQTYPGVNVTQTANGDYLLDLDPEVAGARVIRLMVKAGITVESLVEEPVRSHAAR